MNKITLVFLSLVVILILGVGGKAQTTQSLTGLPWEASVPSNSVHTSCVSVSGANLTNYCFAGDGFWVSTNGGTWVNLSTPSQSGVISVQQCNLAGTSCGTVQTGAVKVNVPSTVSLVLGAPNVNTTSTSVSSVPTATATLQ